MMNYLHPSYNRRASLLTRMAWWGVAIATFFLFVLLTKYTPLGERLFSLGGILWKNDGIVENSSSNEALLLAIKLLSQENRDLQILLGRNREKASFVAGRVLVRPGDKTPYDTLIVDVGSKDGIKKGDKVIIAQKTIIGEIAQVFLNESKILLYSSSGVTSPVLVGEKNIQAEAKGRGGGNYEIILPREAEVRKNSLIIYSGIPSYILGEANVIKESETDNFKKILFVAPFPLGQIRYVDILI